MYAFAITNKQHAVTLIPVERESWFCSKHFFENQNTKDKWIWASNNIVCKLQSVLLSNYLKLKTYFTLKHCSFSVTNKYIYEIGKNKLCK